jgi:mRNA-degrading endonuclease RelE of RelBE toxin-antitoxin system
MGYEVRVTDIAHENIRACVDYVKLVLCQEKSALSIVESLKNFKENVSCFPEMYPKIADERLTNSNYRRALIKNYVVVYEFDGEVVTIHGFYHQLQDYARFVS